MGNSALAGKGLRANQSRRQSSRRQSFMKWNLQTNRQQMTGGPLNLELIEEAAIVAWQCLSQEM